MKLYAPSYYRNFTCIADKCKHSCCIGWEIDVDPDTVEKYRALHAEYGRTIRESIEDGETPHFRLCEGERCPHLEKTGLCRIILTLGEEYLCDICREHPRFYNETPLGDEVGLGMACEEACRLILSTRDFAAVPPLSEDPREIPMDAPLLPRDRMLALLADEELPYARRLQALEEMWDVSPALLEDAEARTLLERLEYLDPESRARFSVYEARKASDPSLDTMLCRALAYFIYRHVSPLTDAKEVRAALGFSLFCERLIASVAAAEGLRTLPEMIPLARAVSEEIEYSEENTEAIKTEFLLRI